MQRTALKAATSAPLIVLGLVGVAVAAAVPASAARTSTPGATSAARAASTAAVGRAVSGSFANLAGQGLPHMSVSVTVAGGRHAVGSSYRAPVVGRTTTRADGSWTLQLPDPLPAAVAAAAAGNGGVLNVVATVNGVAADGMRLVGAEYLPVAVSGGTGATSTGAAATGAAAKVASLGSSVTTPAAAVYPDGHRTVNFPVREAAQATDGPAPGRESALAAVVAAPELYQSPAGAAEPVGFRPALVGGVDYAPVIPMDNPCWALPTKLLKSSISYTTVGETHAYAHASASFAYHSSMSTYVSGVANFGNGPIVLSGGSMLDEHSGVGVGITAAPAPFAYQYKVPIRYNQVRYGSRCLHGGSTYWTGVEALGYSAPGGGTSSRLGRNVISADGEANWRRAPKSHRLRVTRKNSVVIDYQRSLTYTGAASVFGIGVRATTSYDSSHSQTYTADDSTYVHNVWGAADGFGVNADNSERTPKVIYSW
jgi:hypothetical protein